jgi:predicted HTH transcriptional regulator
MNNKEKSLEILKSVLATIATIATVILLLKKLADWLKQLDDDSFKWNDNLGKYTSESNQPSIVPTAVVPAKPTLTKKTAKPKVAKSKPAINKTPAGLNSRQSKIYQIIKANKQIPMQNVAYQINGVSTRTLRRDMNQLENQGLIERVGRTKDSLYRLKTS